MEIEKEISKLLPVQVLVGALDVVAGADAHEQALHGGRVTLILSKGSTQEWGHAVQGSSGT